MRERDNRSTTTVVLNDSVIESPKFFGLGVNQFILRSITCGMILSGAMLEVFAQPTRTYGNARMAEGNQGERIETRWTAKAEHIYDEGFIQGLRKDPKGGVTLFDMDLIENDSPGAGMSEKGVWFDTIGGEHRAKKILSIDDPRAKNAWLVLYVVKAGKHPLEFIINDRKPQLISIPESNSTAWRWTEFPAAWLQSGENTIELACPEAQGKDEGWSILLARADEFADGGGDPTLVGRSSLKSNDGGQTWLESPFGPNEDTRAEYTVRFSLDRYIKTGWLTSPVIDLWKEDGRTDPVVPLRELLKVRLSVQADLSSGTEVKYYLRRGLSTNPWASNWEPYQLVGDGPTLNHEIETHGPGVVPRFRYLQFRAELTTTNPLHSPVIKSANIRTELSELVVRHPNIFVVDAVNPIIQYSSIPWEWEAWDREEFTRLRELENLDEVVAGSRTQFDAQVKLMNYVTRRWVNTDPEPGYPPWDALSILNHLASAGGGGQCSQLNNVLGGFAMAYGWQARLVNVIGHEPVEVWNDEFGKWVFLDSDYENNYNYDPVTGEPLSLLELHQRYLDYYFPDQPIDWMKDTIYWESAREGQPAPVGRGSLTWQKDTHFAEYGVPTGFANAADMRMVPRNNWFEKPTPRPLNHGSNTQWPWTGYITWYDERTPPKRQYAWFTDRPADMWPDLNLVHVDMTQGFGNDRLFLRFDTYTPNFSHIEIDVDDTGWRKVGERWTWLLQSGQNKLRVRAVNHLGSAGRPSSFVINHANTPFAE